MAAILIKMTDALPEQLDWSTYLRLFHCRPLLRNGGL